jgi:hypothetical protein
LEKNKRQNVSLQEKKVFQIHDPGQGDCKRPVVSLMAVRLGPRWAGRKVRAPQGRVTGKSSRP